MKAGRPARKQILVVDDDHASAEILRATLSHAGFRVVRASRGRDALLAASRKNPDLILLDVLLPDINGLEVCRQIKQDPATRTIPVIFVSAQAHPDDRTAGLEAGAEDYITKPFDPLELVTRLRGFFVRTRPDLSLDPLTGLPGAQQLQAELQERLASERPSALLRMDIDDFRIFNHAYGFARGDRAIQVLSSVLQQCVETLGDPTDMVAHLGGDDFAVVSTPEMARTLCEAIIQGFDRKIRTLYRQQDQQRGYLEWQDRLGQAKRYPIMTLSIGVATNENHAFSSHLELLEVALEVQRYSKTLPGSAFSFDRRLSASGIPQPAGARSEATPASDENDADVGSRRDAYVSLIAHELRTPATLMQTAIDVLLTLPMGDLTSEQRSCLLLVQQNCRRLARSVSNLASYDIARHKDISPDVQNFDLQKTVDQVVEAAKSVAESKGIRVEVDGPPTSDPLLTDELRVAKSLWEVIHNAIKFSPRGGCVQIRVRNDNGNASVEVTDDGPGIPRAELLRIFRSFHQVEEPDTRRARGLGLGLFIAKRNMESLGGTLTVRSAIGKGSTFILTFPKRQRSTLERVVLLQDQADSVAEKARSELRRLEESLGERGDLSSGAQLSIDNLRTKLLELEVLTNRAALLAQQMNSECRRERERLQQLKAQLLRSTSPLTTLPSPNHASTVS